MRHAPQAFVTGHSVRVLESLVASTVVAQSYVEGLPLGSFVDLLMGYVASKDKVQRECRCARVLACVPFAHTRCLVHGMVQLQTVGARGVQAIRCLVSRRPKHPFHNL